MTSEMVRSDRDGRRDRAARISAFPWWLLVVSLVALVSRGVAGEEEPNDPTLSGSMGTLPAREDGPPADRLIAGHVRLLARTLDQAIADLQHTDLRGFTESYKQMVDSYTALTDQIGEASEALGAAGTRVELARAILEGMSPSVEIDEQASTELAADIGQMRTRLIARMAALRAQVDHVDSERREKTLHELQLLVRRLENLQSLQASLDQNEHPLAPVLAPVHLEEQLQLMEQMIAEEERLLGVVARSARLMVGNTSTHLRHTMRLLDVQAQLPREQLAQLQQSRAAVQSILDELTVAYGTAAERAGQLLSGGPSRELEMEPEELLRHVDRLVDQAGD